MPKINPFKPNSPISPGMFAGRLKEIEQLENGLFQTKNGHCSNYLITGERGIGKSSLLNLIKPMAMGENETDDYGKFKFVTVSITISDNTNLSSLIALIEKNLKRELGKTEPTRKFLEETWEFVKRIKIMDSGIEDAARTSEIDLVVDDFSYSLSETCKRITQDSDNPKDGIVFFLDEADRASCELHLGYFLKIVTELLQQHGCTNVMLVVAGLPDITEKLSKSHESSLRIFNQLIVRELTVDDREYVIDKGMEEGNKINSKKIFISSDAKNLISTLSEGYPHFIQQFAFSAYAYDSDGEISLTDVAMAAFGKGGALDAIGSRYYQSQYNEQIKSDDYRQVLSIMAGKMNSWIKKSEIRDKFDGNDHVVTDALKTLTDRKIILKNPAKQGEYRLQQRGFALWIKLFGQRDK